VSGTVPPGQRACREVSSGAVACGGTTVEPKGKSRSLRHTPSPPCSCRPKPVQGHSAA